MKHRGDYISAEAALYAAIEADPKHVWARCSLGLLMLKRNDAVGATSSFQEATIAYPQFAPAHVLLGFALCIRQEYSAAEIAFHAAIDAGSFFLARCGLIHVHRRRGDIVRCLESRCIAELQRSQWEVHLEAGTLSLESFFALDRFDDIMDAGAGGWSRPREARQKSRILEFFMHELRV